MTKKMLSAALAAALLVTACGSDDDDEGPSAPTLNTSAAIKAYLDGKTWLMTGDDLPASPNGFNEDVAAFNQCYNQVEIMVAGGTWTVDSTMATVDGTPNCTHQANGTVLSFDSTAAQIGPEVDLGGTPGRIVGNGECFDLRVQYEGFAQAGRGSFSADGETMQLELYFTGQAGGATCADGAVGSGIDTFLGAAVTTQPDSVQVYRLQ